MCLYSRRDVIAVESKINLCILLVSSFLFIFMCHFLFVSHVASITLKKEIKVCIDTAESPAIQHHISRGNTALCPHIGSV